MSLVPYAGAPERKPKLEELDADKGRQFSKPMHNKLAIRFTDHEVISICEFGWKNNCKSFAQSLKLMAKNGRNS